MIAVILRQRNSHFIMAVLGQKIMVIIKNDHKIVAEKEGFFQIHFLDNGI